MVETTIGDVIKPSTTVHTASKKSCDFCKSVNAALFCRKDTSFFCMACDSKLHGQTNHERVLMCEVCEQAPASVTCKEDAATMCVTCDRDIHSANLLARRHVRIPVVPFFNSSDIVINSSPDLSSDDDFLFKFGFRFHDSVKDAVIENSSVELTVDHISTENMFHIHRCVNNTSCNKSNSQSHSVSSSSMDAGVVLEENSWLDVSNLLMLPVNGGGMYCKTKVKEFSAKDREAKVLRYKEKRKKRRFEKKIRYASRKVYAEMRPRIKGRFAKQREMLTGLDGDCWWFTTESNDNGYGASVD